MLPGSGECLSKLLPKRSVLWQERCASENFGKQLLSSVLSRSFTCRHCWILANDEKTKNMGRGKLFCFETRTQSLDYPKTGHSSSYRRMPLICVGIKLKKDGEMPFYPIEDHQICSIRKNFQRIFLFCQQVQLLTASTIAAAIADWTERRLYAIYG